MSTSFEQINNDDDNVFTEEFNKISNGKERINLSDVLKMNIWDINGDFKITWCHIRNHTQDITTSSHPFFLDDDKDGYFTLKDFKKLSDISEKKEKEYKRYEFSSQLQAHFTWIMWKEVCSDLGEKEFVTWIKKLIIQSIGKPVNLSLSIGEWNNNSTGNIGNVVNTTNTNNNESDDDNNVNPNPSKYIERRNLKMWYDVWNVNTTHGIDFQSFFELMKLASDEAENEGSVNNEQEHEHEHNEEFILISTWDFFLVNFIRGFSKWIVDWGFDSYLESEMD